MLQNFSKTISQKQTAIRQIFLSKEDKKKRCSLNAGQLKKSQMQMKLWNDKKLSRGVNHKKSYRNNSVASDILYSMVFSYKNEVDVQNFEQLKTCKLPRWDLSWTLANIKLSNAVLLTLFTALILVRYITILFAIYLIVKVQLIFWEIFLLIFISCTFYWLSLVKLSLKTPETNTQILLNYHFESLTDNQRGDCFRKVDRRKLIITIFKGLVPPELSFLFIGRLQTPRKKKTYLILNFIYCGIEAIIYIPGYLISFSVRQIKNSVIQQTFVTVAILLLSSWILFALLCVLLACKSRSREYAPID